MNKNECVHIHINGIVQGVGFRPFIFNLAHDIGLKGWVCNTSAGVDIEVEGSKRQIKDFLTKINTEPPILATIQSFDVKKNTPTNGYSDFVIINSKSTSSDTRYVSPDVSICDQCLRELFDPKDRRYRYPFINCTNCGPRFTIIKNLPYDRPYTTMAKFQMCRLCSSEYKDPHDRRFHAQPIACPECGPEVWLNILENNDREELKGDKAIINARKILAQGGILAIKGLGGFHLACDASNDQAISELRKRKNRPDKPFALMMFDIDHIKKHCIVYPYEEEVLLSRQRPIVLLKRKKDSELSKLIAPNQNTLGLMLPYTPLHYLILEKESGFPEALIMTSGNVSDDPIIIDNDMGIKKLSNLADAFLLHNRDINIRCDDSVVRVLSFHANEKIKPSGTTYPIRRSRGYAPLPIMLPFKGNEILAVGGELKNTFCLTKNSNAYLSQHIGDLNNFETLSSFEDGINYFENIFNIHPQIIAHDMHPNYLSTNYAIKKSLDKGLPITAIQHHHAHIASCMADNFYHSDEPVIGVAFDGTGYGEDSAIWGGEFFVGGYNHFKRVAHLKYFPLPGGDSAIKEPWKVALSFLYSSGIEWNADLPPLIYGNGKPSLIGSPINILKKQLEKEINTIQCSSIGRLFDAVSSLIGIRHITNYEGQAAIELEALTINNDNNTYHFAIAEENDVLIFDPAPVFIDIIHDLNNKCPPPTISTKFHNALCFLVVDIVETLKHKYGLSKVVLSGGVWQNMYLLENTIKNLISTDNSDVMFHKNVPTNDGGISLGQSVIANKIN